MTFIHFKWAHRALEGAKERDRRLTYVHGSTLLVWDRYALSKIKLPAMAVVGQQSPVTPPVPLAPSSPLSQVPGWTGRRLMNGQVIMYYL